MTLHALRLEVGDDDFFRILRRWARSQAGGNVTTDEFITLAERTSRTQLDDLFDVWLFTPERPATLEAAAARSGSGSSDLRQGSSTVRRLMPRHDLTEKLALR